MEVIFNPNSFLLVNSAHSQYYLDPDAKWSPDPHYNLRHGHISITGKKNCLQKRFIVKSGAMHGALLTQGSSICETIWNLMRNLHREIFHTYAEFSNAFETGFRMQNFAKPEYMWPHFYFIFLSPSCTHIHTQKHHYYIDFIVINTLIHNPSGIFEGIKDISLSFHTAIKYWKTRNVQVAPEGRPSPSALQSHVMQRASDLHSTKPALTTDAHSRVKCLGMFSAGHNEKLASFRLNFKS